MSALQQVSIKLAIPIALDTQLAGGFDDHLAAEWDALLSTSDANTVFLTSAWLRAWQETLYTRGRLMVAQVRANNRLIGAAAFHEIDGVVQFAGRGPSDYSDIVLASGLELSTAQWVVDELLTAAAKDTARFRHFSLDRVPAESRSLLSLQAGGSRYYCTVSETIRAPTMDMSVVDDRLRKKSLQRHDRGLSRRGTLVSETLTDADDILPILDPFFEQHVERWLSTQYPSLFTKAGNREFYRRVTIRLGPSGVLRFTTIRLDGTLVAAHFGFLQAGRFTWYKPSFDPALAHLSPGEVLIKRLLERAKQEGAAEFDFTIGDEPFKLRFATRVRDVVRVHLTDSLRKARIKRLRVFAKKRIESIRRSAD